MFDKLRHRHSIHSTRLTKTILFKTSSRWACANCFHCVQLSACHVQHSINKTPRCKLSITLLNKQCEVLRVFGLERRPDMLLSQRGRTLRARKAAFRLLCSLGHAQPQCPTPKHQKFRRFRPIWEPDPARKCSQTRNMLENPTPLGYHLDQDAWA